MENIINWLEKNIKIILLVSVIAGALLSINTYHLGQDLKEAREPSTIELLDTAFKSNLTTIDYYTTDEVTLRGELAQTKANKEKAIWKGRCLSKDIDLYLQGLDLENCTENLERFASYNQEVNLVK